MVVIDALPLGGPAGRLHVWSSDGFRRHMAWMADEYSEIRDFVKAMAVTPICPFGFVQAAP
ncbi:MAG: hypothetical protein ACLFUE_08755 [Desulfobacteraceae bacterium]